MLAWRRPQIPWCNRSLSPNHVPIIGEVDNEKYHDNFGLSKGGDCHMTTQQWEAHRKHMDEHIKWPATKQEIVEACQGSDVEPSVLDEIKTKLKDDGKQYTQQEVKSMLVT
jgi:hypothetical protein